MNEKKSRTPISWYLRDYVALNHANNEAGTYGEELKRVYSSLGLKSASGIIYRQISRLAFDGYLEAEPTVITGGAGPNRNVRRITPRGLEALSAGANLMKIILEDLANTPRQHHEYLNISPLTIRLKTLLVLNSARNSETSHAYGVFARYKELGHKITTRATTKELKRLDEINYINISTAKVASINAPDKRPFEITTLGEQVLFIAAPIMEGIVKDSRHITNAPLPAQT